MMAAVFASAAKAGFTQFDPFEDTERTHSPPNLTLSTGFTQFDPFEDTESELLLDDARSSGEVSPNSIRSRILKGRRGKQCRAPA